MKLPIGSKKVEGCKNGTNLLCHHAKYSGDHGSRAGCRRKSVMNFCYRQPARSAVRVAQPFRYCFYSLAQKWVFRPAGATRCPDKRESWHGGAAGPLPRANFHVYRGKNVGIQPPKPSKFLILARNLYLRGDSFAIFLRNSQRLYASIGSF